LERRRVFNIAKAMPRAPIFRLWTDDEIAELIRMMRAGLPDPAIAIRLKRTLGSVRKVITKRKLRDQIEPLEKAN
jgi:hypothetical protein